jgi:hypothetical protein
VPWLLSPTGPQDNKATDSDPRRGLTPWLCLVVVSASAATLSAPASSGGLPTLSVIDSELPDLRTAWLFAHAQWMTLATDDPTQALTDLISQQGERALSRLLAPRFLQPSTSYLACVVPTFAPPNGAATLSPAWQHANPAAQVTLPVYYSWRFTTGPAGDFLSLVKRLKRWDQGGVGTRPLDIGSAGAGMPSPASGQGPWLISLEGALVSADVVPGAWTDPQTKSQLDPATRYLIQQGLANRLNGTKGELTPPVYGSTQASFSGPLSAPAVPAGASAVAGSETAAAAPMVTAVNPPSGSAAGGDTVTLTGSGFSGATAVSFGTTAATGLTVAGDTQLTVTSPAAAAAGPVDVTVTTPAGASAISAQDQFTYVPAWLRTLNLDPRYRAAASLGADLVRANQEALALSAWDQAKQVRAANQVLRQGQLARELGQSSYTRRIDSAGSAALPMDDDRLMQVTRAVQAQIPAPASADKASQASVADALAGKPAVAAALSVPFRRLASPGGPLASRLVTAPLPPPVTGLDTGTIRPTPPLSAVSGLVTLTSLAPPGNADSRAGQVGGITLGGIHGGPVNLPGLWWEQGTPQGGPLLLQAGYLADLWVVGSQVGRALDWDGTILQGCAAAPVIAQDSADFAPGPAVAPGSASDWYAWFQTSGGYITGGAACLISWGPLFTGIGNIWEDITGTAAAVAKARIEPSDYPGIPYFVSVECELRGDLIPNDPNAYVPVQGQYGAWPTLGIFSGTAGGEGANLPPLILSAAASAGDLTGSGYPSLAVAWSANPGAFYHDSQGRLQEVSGPQVTVCIGVDVTGRVAKTLNASVPATGDVQAAALANGQLYVLAGGELWSAAVDGDKGTIGSFASHDWFTQDAPPGWVWATITAADFTGQGSADLLVFYAIAEPGDAGATAYRAAYRIGYQPDANGNPTSWSEDVGAPMPVTGTQSSLVLGPVNADTTKWRAAAAAAFRQAAQATQARMNLVIPPPPASSPPPQPVVPGLAAAVRAGIDPQTTVPSSVTGRLSLPGDLPAGGDVLQPLAVTPSFPQPFFETVRDAALPRLIPGLSSFPDEAITVLGADPAAVEAVLVGANHELSRELLWRGVPVPGSATFFARFWDRQDADGKPLNDITGIAAWPAGSDLGSHSRGAELAVLLLRGELVRRFPHVTLYAAPAVPVSSGSRTIDLTTRIDPVFSGTLGGDSLFAGFPFTTGQAQGGSASPGVYFVFQEHPTAPRFGLNPATDPVSYGTVPADWSALDWAATVPDQAGYDALTYLDASQAAPLWKAALPDTGAAGATRHQWGFSAAHMAYITQRPPALIAIHADTLLAAGGTGGSS